MTKVRPPKFVRKNQWDGYKNPLWRKSERNNVTIMFNFVERWKSYFMQGYFVRKGFRFMDMGEHTKEDVRIGREYGNRMECNPMYFTCGTLLRKLFDIEKTTGKTKDEIVKSYMFLAGGGQFGPCRYGMYPQEYLKALNDAGFKDFRISIFSSDMSQDKPDKDTAFHFDLNFKINLLIAIVLADLMHVAECALRPHAVDINEMQAALDKAEKILLDSLMTPFFPIMLPLALVKVGKLFASVKVSRARLPKIYITGEFFANHAHNDGNYNLRRFIMDEGCEVYPAIFVQRVLYDNWRREQEAARSIRFAGSVKERNFWKSALRRQKMSSGITRGVYHLFCKFLNPQSFGGHIEIFNHDELASIGKDYYHPEIFGGESHLEVAEAIHYVDKIEGFISCKPFGCMPSSGVSDGVMAKIISMYPDFNFLSIETSGDNEVSILSRVSMLIFKAKEKVARELKKEKNGDENNNP